MLKHLRIVEIWKERPVKSERSALQYWLSGRRSTSLRSKRSRRFPSSRKKLSCKRRSANQVLATLIPQLAQYLLPVIYTCPPLWSWRTQTNSGDRSKRNSSRFSRHLFHLKMKPCLSPTMKTRKLWQQILALKSRSSYIYTIRMRSRTRTECARSYLTSRIRRLNIFVCVYFRATWHNRS